VSTMQTPSPGRLPVERLFAGGTGASNGGLTT
jgi:hypothetical protein